MTDVEFDWSDSPPWIITSYIVSCLSTFIALETLKNYHYHKTNHSNHHHHHHHHHHHDKNNVVTQSTHTATSATSISSLSRQSLYFFLTSFSILFIFSYFLQLILCFNGLHITALSSSAALSLSSLSSSTSISSSAFYLHPGLILLVFLLPFLLVIVYHMIFYSFHQYFNRHRHGKNHSNAIVTPIKNSLVHHSNKDGNKNNNNNNSEGQQRRNIVICQYLALGLMTAILFIGNNYLYTLSFIYKYKLNSSYSTDYLCISILISFLLYLSYPLLLFYCQQYYLISYIYQIIFSLFISSIHILSIILTLLSLTLSISTTSNNSFSNEFIDISDYPSVEVITILMLVLWFIMFIFFFICRYYIYYNYFNNNTSFSISSLFLSFSTKTQLYANKKNIILTLLIWDENQRILVTKDDHLPYICLEMNYSGKVEFTQINTDFLRMFKTSFNWTSMETYMEHLKHLKKENKLNSYSIDIYKKFMTAIQELSTLTNIPIHQFGHIYWKPYKNHIMTILFKSTYNKMNEYISHAKIPLRFVYPQTVQIQMNKFLRINVDEDENYDKDKNKKNKNTVNQVNKFTHHRQQKVNNNNKNNVYLKMNSFYSTSSQTSLNNPTSAANTAVTGLNQYYRVPSLIANGHNNNNSTDPSLQILYSSIYWLKELEGYLEKYDRPVHTPHPKYLEYIKSIKNNKGKKKISNGDDDDHNEDDDDAEDGYGEEEDVLNIHHDDTHHPTHQNNMLTIPPASTIQNTNISTLMTTHPPPTLLIHHDTPPPASAISPTHQLPKSVLSQTCIDPSQTITSFLQELARKDIRIPEGEIETTVQDWIRLMNNRVLTHFTATLMNHDTQINGTNDHQTDDDTPSPTHTHPNTTTSNDKDDSPTNANHHKLKTITTREELRKLIKKQQDLWNSIPLPIHVKTCITNHFQHAAIYNPSNNTAYPESSPSSSPDPSARNNQQHPPHKSSDILLNTPYTKRHADEHAIFDLSPTAHAHPSPPPLQIPGTPTVDQHAFSQQHNNYPSPQALAAHHNFNYYVNAHQQVINNLHIGLYYSQTSADKSLHVLISQNGPYTMIPIVPIQGKYTLHQIKQMLSLFKRLNEKRIEESVDGKPVELDMIEDVAKIKALLKVLQKTQQKDNVDNNKEQQSLVVNNHHPPPHHHTIKEEDGSVLEVTHNNSLLPPHHTPVLQGMNQQQNNHNTMDKLLTSLFTSCNILSDIVGHSGDLTLSSLYLDEVVNISPQVSMIAFVTCKMSSTFPKHYLKNNMFIPLPLFEVLHFNVSPLLSRHVENWTRSLLSKRLHAGGKHDKAIAHLQELQDMRRRLRDRAGSFNATGSINYSGTLTAGTVHGKEGSVLQGHLHDKEQGVLNITSRNTLEPYSPSNVMNRYGSPQLAHTSVVSSTFSPLQLPATHHSMNHQHGHMSSVNMSIHEQRGKRLGTHDSMKYGSFEYGRISPTSAATVTTKTHATDAHVGVYRPQHTPKQSATDAFSFLQSQVSTSTAVRTSPKGNHTTNNDAVPSTPSHLINIANAAPPPVPTSVGASSDDHTSMISPVQHSMSVDSMVLSPSPLHNIMSPPTLNSALSLGNVSIHHTPLQQPIFASPQLPSVHIYAVSDSLMNAEKQHQQQNIVTTTATASTTTTTTSATTNIPPLQSLPTLNEIYVPSIACHPTTSSIVYQSPLSPPRLLKKQTQDRRNIPLTDNGILLPRTLVHPNVSLASPPSTVNDRSTSPSEATSHQHSHTSSPDEQSPVITTSNSSSLPVSNIDDLPRRRKFIHHSSSLIDDDSENEGEHHVTYSLRQDAATFHSKGRQHPRTSGEFSYHIKQTTMNQQQGEQVHHGKNGTMNHSKAPRLNLQLSLSDKQ